MPSYIKTTQEPKSSAINDIGKTYRHFIDIAAIICRYFGCSDLAAMTM